MTAEPDNVKEVSRFEANLLRILYFLLRRDPAGHALELIYQEFDAPPCLSRACVNLVQDALAKGCVSNLARAGGWQCERYLRAGQVTEGRLWERHTSDDLALSFSQNTLRFLIWITAESPAGKHPSRPTFDLEAFTHGDWLFFYFAFGALRGSEREVYFGGKELFFRDPLCRLAFPQDFHSIKDKRPLPFAQWTTGKGAAILEALQPELMQRWHEVERDKAQVRDWQRMQALGRSQERVLVSFLDAVEQAGRRDLASFLLPVLHGLLPDHPRLEWWTGGLQSTGPRLMDRTATHQAALVLLRLMGRLQEWETQARGVGYFEEEYAASQLWKSDWEHWHGAELWARAQSLLRQIEPLRRQ
jgi:hypothetical protein